MKWKFMSQDTCLILFNIWMAVFVVCCCTETSMGRWIGIMMSGVFMVVAFLELMVAAQNDRKHYTLSEPDHTPKPTHAPSCEVE